MPFDVQVDVVPQPIAFDEGVSQLSFPERSPSRPDSSTRKSSTASEQSYLSYASLRATSKLAEEEVIDLSVPQPAAEDHPEFLAWGDFQLHDPVDAERPMRSLADSAMPPARGQGAHYRCWRQLRSCWTCCAAILCQWRTCRTKRDEAVPLLYSRAHSHGRRKGMDPCCEAPTTLPAKTFELREYEPHMFRRIRYLVGVSDDVFAAAAFETDKEKFNMGRSGAYLYYSNDNRFIIKTMEKEEVDVLLDILDDYCTFLEHHPHSLLTRFFGCYSLHMFDSTTYFVVMENVFHAARAFVRLCVCRLLRAFTRVPPFPDALHERYDLKGSWVNRHRERIEKGQSVRCRYCSQKFEYSDSYVRGFGLLL